ncbi:MAG: hypothetical protein K9M45_10470 [Kiritimatiellales bacterium]|nr:hypothetical protein [Kiritimatiellales bacterium]
MKFRSLLAMCIACGIGFSFTVSAESTITVNQQKYRVVEPLFLETFEAYREGEFPESLLAPGLNDAARFDPVAQAFGRFHYEVSLESLDFCANAIREKAKELKGRDDFTVSGNFGSLMDAPGSDWVRWARIFDCINLEWGFNEKNPADPASLTFFSILNAIGRPATIVGKADNNRKWRIYGDNPVYLVMMVAEAYATGHSVTVPYALFDGTRGESRYFGNIDRMAKIYRFISARKRLFDGYEPVSTHAICVPADTYGGIYDSLISKQVSRAARSLTPYRIILSGTYLPRLDAKKLSGIETAGLVGESNEIRPEDRAVIQDLLKRKSAAGPVFKVGGSDNIRIFPRASVKDKSAPLVVHLLNKDSSYDGSVTTIKPVAFTFSFHRRLVQNGKVQNIVLHTDGGETVPLAFKMADDYISVEIPRLSIWGILEIPAGDLTNHPGLLASVPPKKRPYPQSEIILMRPGHRYEKPDHVVKALMVDGKVDETKVVELYGITRISWEYQLFKGFREKGVSYVGTVNASHLDIERKGEQWDGWARKADGSIMPDKSGGTSLGLLGHATEAFKDYLISQAEEPWIAKRDADGVQWDGTPSMAIKVWEGGGDYSKGSVQKFPIWLAKTYSAAELEKMGIPKVASFDIKSYMQGLAGSSQFFSCGEFKGHRCFSMRQKDLHDKETRDLVGTPTLQSRTGLVLMTTEFMIPEKGSGAPRLSFHLKDGGGKGLYGTYGVNNKILNILSHEGDYSLPFPVGKWVTFSILCDFDRQTAAVSLDGEAFTPFYELRRPGMTKEGFSYYFLKAANSRDVYIRKMEILDLMPERKDIK